MLFLFPKDRISRRQKKLGLSADGYRNRPWRFERDRTRSGRNVPHRKSNRMYSYLYSVPHEPRYRELYRDEV